LQMHSAKSPPGDALHITFFTARQPEHCHVCHRPVRQLQPETVVMKLWKAEQALASTLGALSQRAAALLVGQGLLAKGRPPAAAAGSPGGTRAHVEPIYLPRLHRSAVTETGNGRFASSQDATSASMYMRDEFNDTEAP